MSDDRDETLRRYVDAAARLTQMPLTTERRQAAAIALTRVAAFAAHLEAFEPVNETGHERGSAAGSAS